MVQPSILPNTLPADLDRRVVLFPTRSAADVATELPAQSAGSQVSDPEVGVSIRIIREVVILEAVGQLAEVVGDLNQAIQLSLAEGPRGVVCDLSAVSVGADTLAVEVLATAGRHVRDWSGIPVAVASPDPQIRAALRAHPLGGLLIVTESMLQAVSAVLATPVPDVEWLRLAPHPTSPRASRDFVTRTLLDWGLGRLILSVGLVVSELVANSTMRASTDIELSVAWHLGALRLTVRDDSPDLPREPYSHFDPHGRRLSVVVGLARASGVLPTVDGGKVTWAVINAARPVAAPGDQPAEGLDSIC